MIAILCTDGVMQLSDIYNECQKNKWVPVLVYRKGDDPTPIVVTFNSEDTAKRFAQRNIRKGWLLGAVYLGDEGVEYIKSRGWRIETMDWPRRLSDFELGYEVVDFATKPEVYCGRA